MNHDALIEELSEHPERLHVIPRNDLRDHVSLITCWCHPTPADDCESVIVHHSLDRREEYEEGRKPS